MSTVSSRNHDLELAYRICDVFTDKPLDGNPLAVFEDAGELSGAQMQSLAREMNLSETTFIVRRDESIERAHGVRVRIFTVQEELPFAGHPTLGTASMIRQFLPEYADREEILLDLQVGPITVRFDPARNLAGSRASFGEMTQRDPKFGQEHDPAVVAKLLGLEKNDLALEMPIQTCSTGMPFCIVPIASLEALATLRVSLAGSAAYFNQTDAKFFYCIAREGDHLWRARMQFYNGEDPATGSAAGCAISYLVRGGFESSEKPVHIRQGIEMARPSDLYVRARLDGADVHDVRVGGSTVAVANCRFFL
jgi:trans-2,3-dihydro-3-hydroxyanthranilate isomerase